MDEWINVQRVTLPFDPAVFDYQHSKRLKEELNLFSHLLSSSIIASAAS